MISVERVSLESGTVGDVDQSQVKMSEAAKEHELS